MGSATRPSSSASSDSAPLTETAARPGGRFKYNPAFLSSEDLVASFVVRHADLELLLRVVRENDGNANQHVMVLGPRGIGKTMLVRRVAAEVRRDPQLSGSWFAVPLAEESYQVGTPGELWLEAMLHLAHAASEDSLLRAHEELRREKDDTRLRERALSSLLDFADRKRRRLLLVVESFHMLLDDQMSADDAWTLRHTLLNEPRIMLLATATTRAEAMENEGQALYELFREHRLRPLEADDCRRLWQETAGADPGEARVRPIQILTGGNPRLLVIVGGFAARVSLRELMSDLSRLIDEHTEYFKSHLDALPATERRVYLALAEHWDPSTARQIAAAARVDVNTTSALLTRLEGRGLVAVDSARPRRKLYQVAERMYNIYYLLRRQGRPTARVRAIVNFMESFYGPNELPRLAVRIAAEACHLSPGERGDHYHAFAGPLACCGPTGLRDEVLARIPPEFLSASDVPDDMRSLTARTPVPSGSVMDRRQVGSVLQAIDTAFSEGRAPTGEQSSVRDPYSWLVDLLGGGEEAEPTLQRAVEQASDDAAGYILLGILLSGKSDRLEAAEQSLRKATSIDPRSGLAWRWLGRFLHFRARRIEEAIEAYRKALDLAPDDVASLKELAEMVEGHGGDRREAERLLRRAAEIRPADLAIWDDLTRLLADTGRPDEALAMLEEHEKDIGPHLRWWYTGVIRQEQADLDSAESAFRRSIEAEPLYAQSWIKLGAVLEKQGRSDEAGTIYRKVLAMKGGESDIARAIGGLLRTGRGSEASSSAKSSLDAQRNNHRLLDAVAREFAMHADEALLEHAEGWARDAVLARPHSGSYRHTLAYLLARRDLCQDALAHASSYLNDEDRVRRFPAEAIRLVTELAARGFARQSADLIARSPSAQHLEPLLVGLRLFMGEEVHVAVEFREVGEDVRRRIEARQQGLASERETGGERQERDPIAS